MRAKYRAIYYKDFPILQENLWPEVFHRQIDGWIMGGWIDGWLGGWMDRYRV